MTKRAAKNTKRVERTSAKQRWSPAGWQATHEAPRLMDDTAPVSIFK